MGTIIIGVLNYLSISICLTNNYTSIKRLKFDWLLFVLLQVFIPLELMEKDKYLLIYCFFLITAYGYIRSKDLCKSIYYSVDAIFMMALFVQIIALVFNALFGLFFGEVVYAISMIIGVVAGSVILKILRQHGQSEDIKIFPKQILLIKSFAKAMGVLFVIFLPFKFYNLKIIPIEFNIFVNFFYICVTLLFYFLDNYFYKIIIDSINSKKEFEIYEEYQKMVERNFQEIVSAKHLLKDLIGDNLGAGNKLIELIKDWQDELDNKIFSIALSENIDKIAIERIRIFLSTVVLRCKASNITLNILVSDKIEKINMDITDLVKLLITYTGNAIEEAQKVENPMINIYFEHKDKALFIGIENSLTRRDVQIKNGFGLELCGEIIAKYKNIERSTYTKIYMFVQELYIGD